MVGEIGECNGAEVSPGPITPSPRMPDEIAGFPSQDRVLGLVQRYRSVRTACRAAKHGAGAGGPSPNFLSSVDLTLNRARRMMACWHPELCRSELVVRKTPKGLVRKRVSTGTLMRDPVEHWLQLDDRASRMRARAARHQLERVRASWSTVQPEWRDSPAQRTARYLWIRADHAVDALVAYEDGPEFQLLLAFLAIVLVLWSVHEEPETFWLYVYG